MKIQPGVQGWYSMTVDSIFTNCLNYNTDLQSHMMKNSEWGAVAYLAISIYGKNDEVTANTYKPGGRAITGGGENNAYIENIAQSTTGNITGIYDISGGLPEYVAGYQNNSWNTKYGASCVRGQIHLKNIYQYTSSANDSEGQYQVNKAKYGDALYETSGTGGSSTGGSWFGKPAVYVFGSETYFRRGGETYGSGGGLFHFWHYNGNSGYGFRPVLIIPSV